MEFGILNQSPILDGLDVPSSLRDTIDLAVKADKLGYRRYFLSEHHNDENLAGTSPEIMISHLLAHTERINIGAGGVMLQHYSPFKTAEQFQLLSHLAPGRVDLGVGKAPGGLPLATQALQYELQKDGPSFDEKFKALKLFVNQTHEGEWKDLKTSPDVSDPPEIYLLGSSANSAKLAAAEDVNFIYAHFINNDEQKLHESIEAFKAQETKGKMIVALSVAVTEDAAVIEKIQKESAVFMLHYESGKILRVGGEDKALKFVEATDEKIEIEKTEPHVLTGSREDVLQKIQELTAREDIDELMFHFPTTDQALRHRTVEALAPARSIHKKGETISQ